MWLPLIQMKNCAELYWKSVFTMCIECYLVKSDQEKTKTFFFFLRSFFFFFHLKIIRHIWIFVKHKNCYYVTAISDISFSYAGEQIQVKYVLPNLRCKCIFEIWFVFAFLTTLQILRNLRLSFVMVKACFLNLFCYFNIGD